MDPPASCRISVPGSTQEHGGRQSIFAYGAVTLFGRLSHTFPLIDCFVTSICRSYNPVSASRDGLGCFPFARHYSGNTLFSSGYLDVSVPQVPLHWSMCSTSGYCRCAAVDFSIRKSSDRSPVHGYPRLIAVSRVLHRHLAPRHSP